MTTSDTDERIYSHILLHQRQAHTGRWRIGYTATPAGQPGQIRVSRAVAAQICHDLMQLHTETIQDALAEVMSYADALAEADAILPRLHLDGSHLIADWRHIHGDSGALVCTEPGPDGRYTIGLGLEWCLVTAGSCDTVRDDTTTASVAAAAYRTYAGCFSDPAAALLDLAGRYGIAVAYLDRPAVEAGNRPLTDDEWVRLADHLDGYHEYVAGGGMNAAFLQQAFVAAGLKPCPDNTGTATTGHHGCGVSRTP